MAKKLKIDPVKQETEYIVFLEKRLASKNFKANVSEEEFTKTKQKLDKAKLKLRVLNGTFFGKK